MPAQTLDLEAKSSGVIKENVILNARKADSVSGNTRSDISSDGMELEQSQSKAAEESTAPADMLQRLSLNEEKKPEIVINPIQAYPALKLSGNIISATICLPYTFEHDPSSGWSNHSRRGTSALFEAFAHLARPESGWNHTLVGWTGEILPRTNSKQGRQGSSASLEAVMSPLYKASAPIPINASSRQPNPVVNGVTLSPEQFKQVEADLTEDDHGKIVPVWLYDKSQEGKQQIEFLDQARWRRYAEHDLYTRFHYKQSEETKHPARETWTDYCRMNQKFADRILEVYQPGDIVWIHDYHLMLVPSLLRQKKSDMHIGFFMHVPFPSSELFRCLNRREELLTGVLGSNMIGFQNYGYARHFESCCSRILGFPVNPSGIDAFGEHIALDVFPIGIDAEGVAKLAFDNDRINGIVERVRGIYPGCKIIVGRDRLDTVRGVAQKFQAYEMFLDRHPKWRNKVVLVQVTSPTSIEEEKEDAGNKIASRVSELVSRINGKFGGLEYTPIYHYSQYLTPDEYFALLRVADVGLITSVRDGMNTTSMEYIICQKDNHGPLIISEFSGTASFLTEAISINPWSLEGVSDSINAALTMPQDQRSSRHEKLYDYVVTNNIQEWTRTYIDRLLVNLASLEQSSATPVLDRSKMLDKYNQAKRRLFMFDYDGTLTPIVTDPQAAIPSDRIIRTIKTLARDPKNNVWIISGRDQAFLEEWMGHISELGLSAEHGSYVRQPGSEEWANLTAELDMSWQAEVIEAFTYYTERTSGSFVERKKVAVTWHFRRADPDWGAYQAGECKKFLEETVCQKYDVEVMNGKANLEVRPRFINKGEIAKRLISEYGEEKDREPDFVFCTGDDFTDEDMFRALRDSGLPKENVFTVTVGASSKQTIAYWHLLDPKDVIETIALCNGTVGLEDIGAAATGQRH